MNNQTQSNINATGASIIEAFNDQPFGVIDGFKTLEEMIDEALAQPEGEPVAWIPDIDLLRGMKGKSVVPLYHSQQKYTTALYTHPSNTRRLSDEFKVHITTTKASNGTTYQVVVDHPDRQAGAEPWDAGRKVIFDTSIYGRAEYYRDMWIAFFSYKAGDEEPNVLDYDGDLPKEGES